MTEESKLNIGQLILEQIQIGALMHLSPAMVRRMEVDQDYDPSLRALEVQFSTYMIGNTVHTSESGYECHPLTLWDGIKLKFFPRWLRERFPVRYHETHRTLKVTNVCPHLDFGNRRPHLEYLTPSAQQNAYVGDPIRNSVPDVPRTPAPWC